MGMREPRPASRLSCAHDARGAARDAPSPDPAAVTISPRGSRCRSTCRRSLGAIVPGKRGNSLLSPNLLMGWRSPDWSAGPSSNFQSCTDTSTRWTVTGSSLLLRMNTSTFLATTSASVRASSGVAVHAPILLTCALSRSWRKLDEGEHDSQAAEHLAD
jgi:hypothetical protein